MSDIRRPYPTQEEQDRFSEAIWDLGTQVAAHFYTHPGVTYPTPISRALGHLDQLDYNPIRPDAVVDESEVRERQYDMGAPVDQG